MKNIMTFEEFVKFLESEDSKNERDELSNFFLEEKKNKRILTFTEWSNLQNRDFLFLTYDLINGQGLHPTINNFIENALLFNRNINNRRLPNNCFISFPSPLNTQVMNNYGQRINNFFSNHLPDFRIYLNIANDYYLHP